MYIQSSFHQEISSKPNRTSVRNFGTVSASQDTRSSPSWGLDGSLKAECNVKLALEPGTKAMAMSGILGIQERIPKEFFHAKLKLIVTA